MSEPSTTSTTTINTAAPVQKVPETPAQAPVEKAPETLAPAPVEKTAAPVEKTAVEGAQPVARDWDSVVSRYAQEDTKLANRLARYPSMESALDALVAAQNKIAAGGHKSTLPENPTPEQLTSWRAENGVPESADDYEVSIANPEDLSGDQVALVQDFAAAAHEANLDSAAVDTGVKFMLDRDRAEEAEMAQFDAEALSNAEDALREEWPGQDYKVNKNLIAGLLDMAPQGLKDRLTGARLADGTLLTHDASAMRWLAHLAREVNPVATVTGGGSMSPQAIEGELSTLYKLSADYNSEYWKGPNAERNQSRYRALLAAKERNG